MGPHTTTAPPEGVIVVDKPAGWTSHDVVARIRRLAGTRRVGHAGTLDPMATGVLVVGIGRATRMLGHISGRDKAYRATIRLGLATTTDDAEGDPLGGSRADELDPLLVRERIAALTGDILQRPATVSAIKVDGRRAHARARAGEDVDLPERPVQVSSFDVLAARADPTTGHLDLDVEVVCSSGTYVRALARDLGEALGVGGHLTALRRLRVGPFDLEQARTLDQLAEDLQVIDMARAAGMAFPTITVTPADDLAIRHGRAIDLRTAGPHGGEGGTRALVSADGELLALAEVGDDGAARYLAVFAQPR